MKGHNYSIDILKFICAILVVCLHTNSNLHNTIMPITRCAVPCFFMISGFLLYEENGINKSRLLRNIKHIFNITIWATLLFFVWTEILSIKSNSFFIPHTMQWLEFVFLNENPFGFHLWYLGAYLYVLIIMYIVERKQYYHYLFVITPFLLLCDLIFGKYSLLLLNREIPYICVRNFIFVGIPYFSIGMLMKRYYSKITNINRFILMGVILFVLTSFLERNILISIGKNSIRDHYISTTFPAICLMMSLLTFKIKDRTLCSSIGEKNSLYIYILHPIFITIMFSFVCTLPNRFVIIYEWISPIIIFTVTLIFTIILRKIKIIK